jgi:competence protein CoiA
MQFAIVNGARIEPSPGLKGTCPGCSAPVLAKCGSRNVWHWSHAGKRHCDPWWENETDWHRQWKDRFPAAWREIVHVDGSGERHVADLKTPRGSVIEFQNSPMPPDELRAREAFYGRMLWVINAASFASQFHILDRLPDPACEFAQDIAFVQPRFRYEGRSFWRRSECPDAPRVIQIHGMGTIKAEIEANYRGHHLFDWIRPRSVWYDASAPVYLDFGDTELWRLSKYDDDLRCVRRGSKDLFCRHVLDNSG